MSKTMKKLTLLGAVGALAACGGGVKWTASDFNGMKDAMSNLESHVDEVFDYENFKMSMSGSFGMKEVAKGQFSDDELDETLIEVDVPNLKIHMKTTSREVYVDETDHDNDYENEYCEESWYSYNKEKGFIVQQTDGKDKVYGVIATNEQIEEAASTEGVTKEEILKLTFADGASVFADPSFMYGSILNLFDEDSLEDYFGAPEDATFDTKCYVAGEGFVKFNAKTTYHYDDGDYDVDVVEKYSAEVTNWCVNRFDSSYDETGKYYVTEEEKVDYTYSSTSTSKFTKKVNISIPSLKDYQEVAID